MICYNKYMSEMLAKFTDGLVKWLDGLNLIQILTTIIIAYLLCKIAGPIIGWLTAHIIKGPRNETKLAKVERRKRAKTVADLISFIVKLLIAVTAVYTVLTDLGTDLAPVIASAGLAGVALGFGAQTVVKDMLAGFFIILENQYRVDDVVQISGVGFPATPVEGTVRSITLRRTTLRDRDGNVHTIPNGSIVEVINRTIGYSKFRFTFAVDVDTDVDEIIKIVNDVGDKMAKDADWSKDIVDAPHYDEFGRIGKEGINVTVSGTTMPGKQWRVSAEFRKRLVIELQKSDIVIADVEQ